MRDVSALSHYALTSSQTHCHSRLRRSAAVTAMSLRKRSVAEVSSWRLSAEADWRPQGPRRLRFSFFLFTCQRTRRTNRRLDAAPSRGAHERPIAEAKRCLIFRRRRQERNSPPQAAVPLSSFAVYSRPLARLSSIVKPAAATFAARSPSPPESPTGDASLTTLSPKRSATARPSGVDTVLCQPQKSGNAAPSGGRDQQRGEEHGR